MASNTAARATAPQDAAHKPNEPRLLWNPENVKDVAESVGIGALGDEALRVLSQDVEYRIGQVIVEALRFMRAAKRTNMTVQDMSQALRVLDVEPFTAKPASAPAQPLFYIEDEEVDFEKLINAPLPKVPRDMTFTAHWLAIEGVQPSIAQNPSTSEARSQDMLPKGPGANPALPALAGAQSANFRPAVKHHLSQELILYFEKVQNAILNDDPDPEVERLREAALGSISSSPGIHQLIPYFVTFFSNEVTNHLDDVFILRQVLAATGALVNNPELHLDPYANSLIIPVLTCLMGRRLGSENGTDALKEQYQLRELAASLAGTIVRKFARSNKMLRPKTTRTCLKQFLDPNVPSAVWYGSILGVSAVSGPEGVRILLLPNMKDFDTNMLQKLKEGNENSRLEYEAIIGAVIKAIRTLVPDSDLVMTNGVNGAGNEREIQSVKDFLGDAVGGRLAVLGDHRLIQAVLEAKSFN
ncbi:hypothetical protein PG985_013926 [Apiospora marii]|uniref:uncharacterized protein n=1 Tax=Apiospora marii TaxID=335849 RepID=UPI0031317C82